jgi:hypothetical protein
LVEHPNMDIEPDDAAVDWMDDVVVVGDSFDGPIYTLKDGTVVHIPVPDSPDVPPQWAPATD